MQKCKIQRIHQAHRAIDDGDMLLRRALPSNAVASLGPFVFVDHYAHVSRRGIGDRPHPHAGIEVISYLLEGSVHHRDSMGFSDRIDAGEVQVISAGKGMLHAEVPDGGRHGLQLWTSLPPELKRAPPTYRKFAACEIPHTEAEGVRLKVISGTLAGLTGPLRLARPTVLAHARLGAGARLAASVPPLELGVYVLTGWVEADHGELLGPGSLALLSDGTEIELLSREQGADVLILGGQRIAEDILFAGPFVMDTPDRLRMAQSDFLSGAMGSLDGVPF